MKTSEVEIAVAKYFNCYRANLIVPNISWGFGVHECDLMIVTKAGYAYEVEIKISKSDLMADKKKRHGHKHFKIKKLYFAIPKRLLRYKEHIPEHAGILTVDKSSVIEYGYFCRLERRPHITGDYVLTPDERFTIAKLGCMRIWGLKQKIVDLRDLQACRRNK